MGGFGSGMGIRCEAKLTTDMVPAIDIRQLQRSRELIPGNRILGTWTRGDLITAQVEIDIQHNQLRIRYTRVSSSGEREPVECVVPIASTPCNYGGVRRWFCCPDCRKRIAVIYIHGRSCSCRQCSYLVYRSQRERASERARSRAQNIRVRLGGSANLLEPFPAKPKWMRWKNYQSLEIKALKDQARNLESLRSILERRERPNSRGRRKVLR
jgi:hypothetical protein